MNQNELRYLIFGSAVGVIIIIINILKLTLFE